MCSERRNDSFLFRFAALTPYQQRRLPFFRAFQPRRRLPFPVPTSNRSDSYLFFAVPPSSGGDCFFLLLLQAVGVFFRRGCPRRHRAPILSRAPATRTRAHSSYPPQDERSIATTRSVATRNVSFAFFTIISSIFRMIQGAHRASFMRGVAYPQGFVNKCSRFHPQY